MPRKKISPFQKKALLLKKKVLSFVTTLLLKITSFYKRSEFNRGLVIGLGLTFVFLVGYTAKAALPTTNDIEGLNSTAYKELFPSGYLKPHEMKFFRYYVDDTNANTSEVGVSDGKIVSEANELEVFDDRADTDVNFKFFTNVLNNPDTLSLENCRLANQDFSGKCGKMIEFSHKFYKHIEFFPNSRGANVAPHMYFYDQDAVIKMYVNNTIVPNQGVLQNAALSFLKKFDLNKILDPNKANAQAYQQAILDDEYLTYENLEPDIPTSKKYFITGKISQLIQAGILDPKVFKSKSILERTGTSSSYLFTAMTAEPKSKFINNAPVAYDYSVYFNTLNPVKLNDYYKKEIKKLTLKDTYDFNSSTKTWNLIANPIYREVKLIDFSGNSINEFFYNTSVSNFVNIKTSSLAGLVYNIESSAGGFQRMYIYKGTGTTAPTPLHNINIRVGNISNNPCNYTDIPCQSTLEFEEPIYNISFSPKKSNSLLSFLIPKRANAQSSLFGDGGFLTFASGNASMKSLIDSGILSGHMFRPSAHFVSTNPNKPMLYWKKEIVDYDYNENPTSKIPSLFDDLSKGGTGIIHTANFSQFLDLKWDQNYQTNDFISITTDYNGPINLSYSIIDLTTGLFKFIPRIQNSNGDNILISPGDTNILDNNPPAGSNSWISLCVTDYSDKSNTCLNNTSGTATMSDYNININNLSLPINNWDGGSVGKRYKYVKLKIMIYTNYASKISLKDTLYAPIKLTEQAQAT